MGRLTRRAPHQLTNCDDPADELLAAWGSMADVFMNIDALDITERQRDILRAVKSVQFIREEKPTINSPADSADHFKYLSLEPQENLVVMGLDRRNHFVAIWHIYKGSANSAQVRVGELFKQAIVHNCSAIILCHNHPSGDPTPSPDDVAMTRNVVQAGKLLDIDVLDHIVMGLDRWASLKERGLGFS